MAAAEPPSCGGDDDDAHLRARSGCLRLQLRRVLRLQLRQGLRLATWCCVLLADLCARALSMVDCLMKLLGVVLVIAAIGLVGFVSYTFFALWLPYQLEDPANTFKDYCAAVVGAFVLANVAYNYAMAVCTDPGLPPKHDGVEAGATRRQCKKCLRQRPARTHHCSVCRRCVLRMDHHCPWINNCVGFRNHRFFCLFLLFLFVGCIFIEVVFWEAFTSSIVHRRKRMPFQLRQFVSLSWILAACISVALGLLGGFHVYLVMTNQTTIEFQMTMERCFMSKKKGESYRNPYDLGAVRNIQDIFGPGARGCWLFPLLAQRPLGDGMHYSAAC